MTDAFTEAISTDDSPAPEPSRARIPLLGDPHTEGNEHLLDELDESGTAVDADAAGGAGSPGDPAHRRLTTDDLHFPLANSDVQN
jgi:hypothetical protein